MPKPNQFLRAVFFAFFSLFITSCSTSKLAVQPAAHYIEISQNSNTPYVQEAENTLVVQEDLSQVQEQEVNPADGDENKIVSSQKKLQGKVFYGKVKRSEEKLRKLMPDTRPVIQSASKEWKPRKENFSMGWKDVLFIIILLALLALLGGFLHSAFGISLVLTMSIAIIIAFVVSCIYIWYLHNN